MLKQSILTSQYNINKESNLTKSENMIHTLLYYISTLLWKWSVCSLIGTGIGKLVWPVRGGKEHKINYFIAVDILVNFVNMRVLMNIVMK